MPPQTKLSKKVHFAREVRFARQELADGGLLSTLGGAWRLQDSAVLDFTVEDIREIARQNTRRRWETRQTPAAVAPPADRARAHPRPAPTTGPRPASWKGIVLRDPGPAATYVFRFEAADVWKLGFAADVQSRLGEINRHVPVELLRRRWLLVCSKPWPSSEQAYRMEQRVLELLTSRRSIYERVQCSERELSAAWQAALEEMGG